MIKRYIKWIVFSDNAVNRLGKTLYYHCRYYIVNLKIFLYCKKYKYPQSRIFLTIQLDYLENTEFDSAGNRKISSRNVYRIIGKVIDGDWDLYRSPIQDWKIYKGLKEYLIDGKDLKDTVYYRNDTNTRVPLWLNITGHNYQRERERNKNLFRLLKENGYLTQKELGGPDPLDEIRVKIGRDGEFLWENSIHRFIIAKLLKLEKITVVVTVRHHDWINLKKKLIELAQKRDGSQINEERNLRYYHPDLEEIPYCREGEKVIEKHLETQKSITTKTEVVV